jgi:gamma-glutamyl:cysteine ligase YbdK (ATP-grasp superfamily)
MRFGIEIEFCVAVTALPTIKASLPAGWTMDTEDVEVISPIYTSIEVAAPVVREVCQIVQRHGGVSDELYADGELGTRGLHVHLDRDDLGPSGCRTLMTRYYSAMPELNARWPERARNLLPGCGMLNRPHLTACEYCRPACGPHTPIAGPTLNTIEVRQHPATLDPDTIMAWVVELYQMAAA